MQRLLASLTIVLLLGMVITRVLLMRRSGIRAMYFGKIDKKDFLIPPFALFYFYIVFAAAFGLPMVSKQQFFDSEALSWLACSSAEWGCCCSCSAWSPSGEVFALASTQTTPTNSLQQASLRRPSPSGP